MTLGTFHHPCVLPDYTLAAENTAFERGDNAVIDIHRWTLTKAPRYDGEFTIEAGGSGGVRIEPFKCVAGEGEEFFTAWEGEDTDGGEGVDEAHGLFIGCEGGGEDGDD